MPRAQLTAQGVGEPCRTRAASGVRRSTPPGRGSRESSLKVGEGPQSMPQAPSYAGEPAAAAAFPRVSGSARFHLPPCHSPRVPPPQQER
ncbi:hypothetical protein NDU88_001941 [Pleurodeles waltl]|uniref:Uncharacterized protein n=1 Tax=Pleurodeles waltl TaxID=8319 RepID=A0AAV7NE15_PLEWA|nr:hypothetical protein NDU88_001941 [Pleurodeles waltl]